jgi:hypothetical protein
MRSTTVELWNASFTRELVIGNRTARKRFLEGSAREFPIGQRHARHYFRGRDVSRRAIVHQKSG